MLKRGAGVLPLTSSSRAAQLGHELHDLGQAVAPRGWPFEGSPPDGQDLELDVHVGLLREGGGQRLVSLLLGEDVPLGNQADPAYAPWLRAFRRGVFPSAAAARRNGQKPPGTFRAIYQKRY